MRTKLFILVLGISFFTACSSTARFYPVQGKLVAQTPSPVFYAKLTGKPWARSGDISAVLGDSETFNGRWTRIDPVPSKDATSAPTSSANHAMATSWDVVYGPGYYVSHVLGQRVGIASQLVGSKGTVLDVEFFAAHRGGEDSPAIFQGVAKDNKDNLYKVVF